MNETSSIKDKNWSPESNVPEDLKIIFHNVG